MIFFAKSATSLLYDAGSPVLYKDLGISLVYLTVIGSTAILYSLQKHYSQIDLKPNLIGAHRQPERQTSTHLGICAVDVEALFVTSERGLPPLLR